MFIINRIVFVLNSIVILLLMASYLAPFISPEFVWQMAFLGLAYPILILINVLFIVYWLAFLNMKFIFSLTAIVLGWNFIPRYIQFNEKKMPTQESENVLRIMSFNARYFGLLDGFNSKDADLFIDKIDRINPDIVCSQEYYIPGKSGANNELATRVIKRFESYYISNGTSHNDVKHTDNLIIYSKYPIINTGVVERENGNGNYTIYADVIANKDTLRIITTHLQSIGFSQKEYAAIQSLMGESDSISYTQLRNVGSKMKFAFLIRAKQVEAIRTFIDQSPYKVIVCGDFNDSPVSYAYRTIKNDLKDAFMEAGSGLGRTYIGTAPSLRIDYILTHPDFDVYDYYAKGFDFSDHKMVSCSVKLSTK